MINKKAFTIIEIVIVIFLILMVASIFIPLNLANVKQAERIARWKNTFDEVKYSFEMLRAQDEELFNPSKDINSKDLFVKIKPYLNIKHDKIGSDYFQNYKYKFLNGRKVNQFSNFYFSDLAMLESGVIIGFKLNDNRSSDPKSPFGLMMFDINGLEKPNKFGVDIFGIRIFPDRIEPFGEGRSHSALKVNCSPIGTGLYCSKYYLIGGKI